MKIIDTFLFSEPHEEKVLLAKLHAEYEIVDQFILIESPFDFRGKPKGLFGEEIVSKPEFKEFVDKFDYFL